MEVRLKRVPPGPGGMALLLVERRDNDLGSVWCVLREQHLQNLQSQVKGEPVKLPSVRTD